VNSRARITPAPDGDRRANLIWTWKTVSGSVCTSLISPRKLATTSVVVIAKHHVPGAHVLETRELAPIF